mmetsp:Transcript_18183/g.40365  ORF Transcript_18183/g.40365 Transcript_18183/m.40365 type:complete len:216 (+) Transcript_18183:893-1540(+)
MPLYWMMLITQLARFAAAADLVFIFSKVNSGSSSMGSTLPITSSGMSSPLYLSNFSLKASTLAIIFLAFSQEKSFFSPLIMISSAVVTLSTPAGGFEKDLSSVSEALSRHFTALFAASSAGLAMARSPAACASSLAASSAAASAFFFSTSAMDCCASASERCLPISSSNLSVAAFFASTSFFFSLRNSCSCSTSRLVRIRVFSPVSRRWIFSNIS